MNVDGPLATRVADLRLALAAMSRPDARDPWHVPAPLVGPPVPRRVTVFIPSDADPEIERALRAAADALAGVGYELEAGEPPRLAEAAELWAAILADEIRAAWPLLSAVAGPEAAAFVAAVLDAVPGPDGARYLHALAERQAIARAWAEHPLILAPVCTAAPFAVGADLEAVGPLLERMRAVVAVNLLGLPAVAVGGVQLIGPRLREDVCLDAAEAVESTLI
jgi:amidase